MKQLIAKKRQLAAEAEVGIFFFSPEAEIGALGKGNSLNIPRLFFRFYVSVVLTLYSLFCFCYCVCMLGTSVEVRHLAGVGSLSPMWVPGLTSGCQTRQPALYQLNHLSGPVPFLVYF